MSLPVVSPPPPSPLLVPPLHQAPVLLFKQEKNIAHKLKVSKTWVLNPPRTSKERWDSLVLRSPSFPRLAIDVHLKDRVCVCVHTGVHLERGGAFYIFTPSPLELYIIHILPPVFFEILTLKKFLNTALTCMCACVHMGVWWWNTVTFITCVCVTLLYFLAAP